jgi:hypothetical protein
MGIIKIGIFCVFPSDACAQQDRYLLFLISKYYVHLQYWFDSVLSWSSLGYDEVSPISWYLSNTPNPAINDYCIAIVVMVIPRWISMIIIVIQGCRRDWVLMSAFLVPIDIRKLPPWRGKEYRTGFNRPWCQNHWRQKPKCRNLL